MKKELVYFPSWMAGRQGYAERIRELFEELLNKRGLKDTRQRRQILEFLLSAQRHVSQEEIYQALKYRGIGRVTVFRALKMLEEARLLDRVHAASGTPRYEINRERPHHDHMICVQCGSILEVRWPQVERVQDQTCRSYGFEPMWHRHEIFGRCRECLSKKA
ncbi:MAG: transcriptional repressor [Elusimicrobia bacterium]|nr:transcriptional repressor [Elusimicrobiota bacterium]